MTTTNTVRIFVGAGASFEVPRPVYDEALTMATLQRRIWYVGLHRSGRCEIAPNRLDLLDKGCGAIAWVCPAEHAMAIGEA